MIEVVKAVVISFGVAGLSVYSIVWVVFAIVDKQRWPPPGMWWLDELQRLKHKNRKLRARLSRIDAKQKRRDQLQLERKDYQRMTEELAAKAYDRPEDWE